MEDWVGLSPEKRELIYRKIASGELSRKDFEKIVAGVPGPDVATAFSELARSNFKLRILAYMAGVGLNNFQSVNADSLKLFLVKFPTPKAFESAKTDFLEAVKRGNTREKYLEYEREMAEFCRLVYGKRLEAEEFFDQLMHDAEEWELNQEAERLKAEFLTGAEIEGDIWPQRGREYKLTP